MRIPGADALSAREIESIGRNRRGFSPVKLRMDHRIPAGRMPGQEASVIGKRDADSAPAPSDGGVI